MSGPFEIAVLVVLGLLVGSFLNVVVHRLPLGESLKAETLAAHIAERVREREQALRAEVTIAARYPETKSAPVSGIRTLAIYTLFWVLTDAGGAR